MADEELDISWMCKQVAHHYGITSQMYILAEECAELAKEALKYNRPKDNIKELVEEIADVEIMLEQTKMLLGDVLDDIKKIKTEKLLRQIERIKRGL